MTRARTLADLFAGTEVVPEYVGCGPRTEVTAVTMDSRDVLPGALFVAIGGTTHDGHAFCEAARAAGASVLLVARDRPPPSGPHVRVSDPSEVLATVAASFFGRPADALRMAAVTGTNGKTTTAHLVGTIVGHAGHRYARLGTTGNWLVDREHDARYTTAFAPELHALLADAVARGGTHAVMEASSHALAQGRLRTLAFAAVGLTSFSQDHLEFHRSMEEYLSAKCLLASEHMRDGAVAIAAVDDQPAAAAFLIAAGAHTRWRASRGADASAELFAEALQHTPAGMRAELHTPMGAIAVHTPLIGAYNFDNLMVAVGLALGLGIDPAAIEDALPHAHGAPGRLQRVTVAGVAGPHVLVDYAHTPDAVRRAIEVGRDLCALAGRASRLFVVLGCGGDRDRSKRSAMGEIAASGADGLFATSDNPRTEDPERILDDMLAAVPSASAAKVTRTTDRALAIAQAIGGAAEQDVVLILGKGHENYQILGTTKIHFDDVQVARAALQRR